MTDLEAIYTVCLEMGTRKTSVWALSGAQKSLKFRKVNPDHGVVQPTAAPYTPSHWLLIRLIV